MSSTSEKGHVKNLSNFKKLISFCKGFLTKYNPSNPELTVTKLEEKHLRCKTAADNVITQKEALKHKTNELNLPFSKIKEIATRTINAFVASGATTLQINTAKSANKALQGSSSKKDLPEENDTDENDDSKSHSTSHQSKVKQLESFSDLLEVCEQETKYNPNEGDLKTTSLKTYRDSLQNLLDEQYDALAAYSNALIERDREFYHPTDGLVKTSKDVKSYIKSVFGAKSSEFKEADKIEFTTPRKHK